MTYITGEILELQANAKASGAYDREMTAIPFVNSHRAFVSTSETQVSGGVKGGGMSGGMKG